MTANPAPQTTDAEPRDARPRRAPAPVAETDTEALVQGLERLRDALLRRLDAIEILAEEQARLSGMDVSEREQALGKRVSTLESAQARLQAEVKRREQEYQAALQELDADRRLIAEAWERLEQEQLDSPPGHATPPEAVERPAAPRPASAVEPAADVVTRSILQQFQALQGDVRRNAKGRVGR